MTVDNGNNKVLNVPHLRFPGFTDEWERIRLMQITLNISAGKDKLMHGNIVLYGSTGVLGTTKNASYSGEMILVARVGANAGHLQLINEQCGVTDNTIVINAGNWNHYLYYYLLHYNLNRIVFGSGQPLITSGMLKKIFITAGNEEERAKIINLLSLIDKRIEIQIKIIEKYESLISGIANLLYEINNGISVRLGDILNERIERTTINNQYEVLSSTVKGIFSQRDYFSKDIASENNIGYKIIRMHDVVLSPQNLWMGNINYNKTYEVGIVSPSYKIYKISPEYDKDYVAIMLKTHRALYNYMLVSEQGASIVRRNLNVESFEQLMFKVPPYAYQVNIGKTTSTIQRHLKIEIAIKKAYERQKQFLLRQMFI